MSYLKEIKDIKKKSQIHLDSINSKIDQCKTFSDKLLNQLDDFNNKKLTIEEQNELQKTKNYLKEIDLVNQDKDKMMQLESELEDYQVICQSLQEENQNLQNDLIKSQNQNKTLQSKLNQEKSLTSHLKTEIRNLKSDFQNVQNDLELQKQKFLESISNTVGTVNVEDPKEVQQQFTNLNPDQKPDSGENNNSEVVQFFKNYVAKKQDQEKNPVDIQQIEKEHETVKKQISQKPKPDQCQLAMIFLLQQLGDMGIKGFLSESQKDTGVQVYQNQMILTGQAHSQKYFSVKPEKEILLNVSNDEEYAQYVDSFKNTLATSLNTNSNNISILNWDQNKNQVDVQINEDIERQKFEHAKGMTVEIKNLLDMCNLSYDMFSPQFNQTWYSEETYTRGVLKLYDQPNPIQHEYKVPKGFTGLALNIEKYGHDQTWIGTGDKAWIVLYHGTTQGAVGSITKTAINPGQNNAYTGSKCRITGNIIQGKNTYLTDSIQVATGYMNEYDYQGEKYHFGFQCRVNPLEVMSPINKPDYYTVHDPTNIRPYRILIKKK